MKPYLSLLISLVLCAIIISGTASASFVFDEAGVLEGKTSQIENTLSDFYKNNGIKVILHTAEEPINTWDELAQKGRSLFLKNGLSEPNDPPYNVLILYSKMSSGESNISYFHSSECSIFNNTMQGLNRAVKRDVAVNMKNAVDDTLKKINYVLNISGRDCILHVCELIRGEGGIKDERYEGFECDDMDTENPKKAHECKKGGKIILCFYDEAYRADEINPTELSENIKHGKTVFITDDSDWKKALSLLPLAVYHEGTSFSDKIFGRNDLNIRRSNVMYNPWIVVHREKTEKSDNIDFESASILISHLYETKETKPEKIVIAIDDVPKSLKLALMDENIGLGLSEDSVKKFSNDDIADAWSARGYDSIVICNPDDYRMGLLSAHLASFLNAPLVFATDIGEVSPYETKGKIIYDAANIGKEKLRVSGAKNAVLFRDESSIANKLAEMIYSDKTILVNPNDIKPEYCESFVLNTEFGRLKKPYCGDSINAPLLASVKNELMVFTDNGPAIFNIADEKGKDG